MARAKGNNSSVVAKMTQCTECKAWFDSRSIPDKEYIPNNHTCLDCIKSYISTVKEFNKGRKQLTIDEAAEIIANSMIKEVNKQLKEL